MMDKYAPMEGDRVLVTGPRLIPGGRTATIVKVYDGKRVFGDVKVVYDDGGWTWVRGDDTFTLLHRPTPRPEVNPITLSNGTRVVWKDGGVWFGAHANLPLVDPSEAEDLGDLFRAIRGQMEWDAKNA